MEIKIVRQAEISGSIQTDTYGIQSSKRSIAITHNGESLYWTIRKLTNTNQRELDEDQDELVFDELNAYFATLPVFTQDMVFEVYKEINTVLKNVGVVEDDSLEDIIESVSPLMTRLFSFFDQASLTDWTWNKCGVRMHPDIKERFESSMPGSAERTYLTADYYELIPLSIIVRAASPVWCEFSELIRNIVANTHRDYFCYKLIERSWPALSPAMRRLELFVRHTVGNDCNNDAVVLAGIGTEAFVHWVLSSVVVKRMPFVDVLQRGDSPTPVVSALYNHVRKRVTAVIAGTPKISHKHTSDSSGGSDPDNNLSYLEGFRNRQPLSIGQEAVGEHYLRKNVLEIKSGIISPNSLLHRIAPDINVSTVIDAMQSATKLQRSAIIEEQVIIASWLFHPYSQARTVGMIDKELTINMLGMAQAVFMHLSQKDEFANSGFLDLAALVSADYKISDIEESIHVVGETVDKPRAVDAEDFKKHYPIERQLGAKKINIALLDVETLIKKLQAYDITCTFSDSTLKQIQGPGGTRRLYLRRDMITVAMNFCKYLATRSVIKRSPDEIYQERVLARQASTIGHF